MIHISCQTGAHWQHGLQQSQQCWPRFSCFCWNKNHWNNDPRLWGFPQNDGVLTALKITDSKEVAWRVFMYFILGDLNACIRLVVYGWTSWRFSISSDNCFITISLGWIRQGSSNHIPWKSAIRIALINGIGISIDMKLQIMDLLKIYAPGPTFGSGCLLCQAKACTKWQEVRQLGRDVLTMPPKLWKISKNICYEITRSQTKHLVKESKEWMEAFHFGR